MQPSFSWKPVSMFSSYNAQEIGDVVFGIPQHERTAERVVSEARKQKKGSPLRESLKIDVPDSELAESQRVELARKLMQSFTITRMNVHNLRATFAMKATGSGPRQYLDRASAIKHNSDQIVAEFWKRLRAVCDAFRDVPELLPIIRAIDSLIAKAAA